MGDRGAVPYMFGVKYSTVNLNDMVFCFLTDMAFFLTDTALYFSNCYGILFSIPRPCNPRVILSEVAPPSIFKRDHQSLPHSEPRPKRGASRRDLAC